MGEKVLVAYATKMGSTRETAETVAEGLRAGGAEVEVREVGDVDALEPYAAVVVGSALYMGRWRGEAVRFLRRHARELAERPVWVFHGGPLDHDPEHAEQPLPGKVKALADRIGVREVATFGGRLAEDAKGFVASKMAQNAAGDFRDFEAIRAWGEGIAKDLRRAA